MNKVRRTLLGWGGLTALLAAGAASASGCTEEATEVDVRSLEQSGPAAFICLREHAAPVPGLPLTTCNRAISDGPTDFAIAADGTVKKPHLYALVTQTTRGEVAVVDTTTNSGSVIDENPAVPGANFLQIGAQPVDIVATPGGTAAFVAVAEVGRPAIYALPSTKLRPCLTQPGADASPEERAKCAPPVISTWPACSLPVAPGAMMLVADPAKDGQVRASCDDATYGGAPTAGEHGDIDAEGNGRQKLLVTLPEMGGIAVFDAQSILDSKPGGSGAGSGGGDGSGGGSGDGEVKFQPCVPERWLPLTVDSPPPQDPKPIAQGAACVVPEQTPSATGSVAPPRPAGIAYAAGRLYVADLDAPVIHVVDMPTPCEPSLRPSLVPTAIDDPKRVVTTTKVAVMPELSADLRRYLYAIDAQDGSTMVFDVSEAKGSRFPLVRDHAEWNPFQATDRIRFGSPARDVKIIQRDLPAGSPVTGTAPEGTRCDPDPRATCDDTGASCDPGALYRTSADYASGAGPYRMRGTFAIVMLAAGDLAVIDVDDLDAACRVPTTFDPSLGCPPASFVRECSTNADCAAGACSALGRCLPAECSDQKLDGEETAIDCGGSVCEPCAWAGSGERSCNVVVPNTPRNINYVLSSDPTGRHEPGIQVAPLLVDKSGTLIPVTDTTAPKLRAPKPATPTTQILAIGTAYQPVNADGFIVVDNEARNTVLMNLEDPRAHFADQTWAIAFEGGLPGFIDKAATLSPDGFVLTDPNSRFCDRGVESLESVREILKAEGSPSDDASAYALADIAQITSDLPDDDDQHWDDVAGACTYQQCKTTFGTGDALRPERDLTITEAYQDRIELSLDPDPKVNAERGELLRCCFPSAVGFSVRAKGQWVVVGGAAGFLHHVIPDPATGVCRNSCDPDVGRMNGRIRTAPTDAYATKDPAVVASITDGGKFVFQNPMFRFIITQGTQPAVRDMQFSFVTQGAFAPLLLSLATTVSQTVQPQSLQFVPPTGELALTDGSLEGLIFVGLSSFSVNRQIF